MAKVYLAPVGTTAPTTATAALAPAWKEVGLFTPDSLKFKTDPQFQEVRSHQSNYPTRRFQTQDGATFDVDLQEWSGDNFMAVYGGGVLSVTGSTYKFAPPQVGARIDVAAIIEIVDGGKTYRRIVPRCTQVEGVEQSFTRANESTLPLRLAVLGSDVGDAWYDLSNDPQFDIASSGLSKPYITSVTPSSVGIAGGTVVTIVGGNLTGATAATFGGTAGTTVTVLSASTITVIAPAHTATGSPFDVVVTTPSGTATKTGGIAYA
jgi:hypothetical protein